MSIYWVFPAFILAALGILWWRGRSTKAAPPGSPPRGDVGRGVIDEAATAFEDVAEDVLDAEGPPVDRNR